MRAFLDQVAEVMPAAELLYDTYAGEEWAYVELEDGFVCQVRAPTSVGRAHRFAFLRSGAAAELLRPLLEAHQVSVVELSDFEERSLSARIDDLVEFVRYGVPPGHVLDPACFAANDLVFVSQ